MDHSGPPWSLSRDCSRISAIVLCIRRTPTKPQAIAVIAYLIRNTKAAIEAA